MGGLVRLAVPLCDLRQVDLRLLVHQWRLFIDLPHTGQIGQVHLFRRQFMQLKLHAAIFVDDVLAEVVGEIEKRYQLRTHPMLREFPERVQ